MRLPSERRQKPAERLGRVRRVRPASGRWRVRLGGRHASAALTELTQAEIQSAGLLAVNLIRDSIAAAGGTSSISGDKARAARVS